MPCSPWPLVATHPVGLLGIPRLGYGVLVLERAPPFTLAFGPARLFSGANMGEPGNLVLAGHRTSWFLPLQGIRQGDTVQLEWFDGHHGGLRARSYTVDVVRVTDPQDVTLLAPTSEDALTLVTCYPFGSSPYSPSRYMVHAKAASF